MIKPLWRMAKFCFTGTKKGEYMKYTKILTGGGCLLELINNSTLTESEVADI